MHELSISNSIAKTVIENAQNNQATRVITINLEIGDLIFLNTDQVRFWLKELFKDTIARDAQVKIDQIKPIIKCLDCNYEGGMKFEPLISQIKDKGEAALQPQIKSVQPVAHTSFPSFLCPECNSYNIEIAKGRECLLKNIKLEV